MRNMSQSATLRMPSLLESKYSLLHLWTSLERKMNPADIFTDGNWILSQSRTMSSRRSDLMVIGMVKLKHRRSTSSTVMQDRDVSKRVFKEFTIAFRKI